MQKESATAQLFFMIPLHSLLTRVLQGAYAMVTGYHYAFSFCSWRLWQASSPGLRGSSSSNSRLCVRHCRYLERLHWWCHVRQAPRRAVRTGSQVASGFLPHITRDTDVPRISSWRQSGGTRSVKFTTGGPLSWVGWAGIRHTHLSKCCQYDSRERLFSRAWPQWVAGGRQAQENRGPTLRGAARSRTLQEGPSVRCGWAASPGKPRVPHCKERPGAAHSRRDQACVAEWAASPGKPGVPHCEERPGAAHSRRDQECVVGWR